MAYTRTALEINQRDLIPKVMKEEQLFLYQAHRLNIIHIVIKFHQDIPYGSLLMACTRNRNQSKECNSKSKGMQSLLQVTYHVNLIYIAIKFHHHRSKGYLVMGDTNIV